MDKITLDVNTLKTLIAELADTNYNKEGKGLLLSQVGEIISKQHPELRYVLRGRKLVEFIEAELANSVHILTSPENKIVKVVLPANVTVNGNVLHFIPRRDPASSLTNTSRYDPAFWAAFSRPLVKGYTRLVGFEPQVHYDDIKGEIPVTTIKKIVTNDFVTDQATEPNPAKRIQRINEKISNWLQTNGVSVDIVAASQSEK